MMGGRSWDEWIEEYAEGHQHPVNRLTHSFGIPMIAISILMVPVCFFVAGLWKIALGLFILGWVLQFVGHYFEGNRRSFSRTGVFSSSGCGGGSRRSSELRAK